MNELSIPVYLIAMTTDANTNVGAMTDYNPTLAIHELSNAVYQDVARTTVCSNVENSLWTKSIYVNEELVYIGMTTTEFG